MFHLEVSLEIGVYGTVVWAKCQLSNSRPVNLQRNEPVTASGQVLRCSSLKNTCLTNRCVIECGYVVKLFCILSLLDVDHGCVHVTADGEIQG